jgi:CDP-6-deoxy-D-xylo-4-hexulose-3-dehydrase
MGAEINGKKCGTFGVLGSFSTFFSHHISTMEGGMIVTDNEELYHILLCLRAHGWTRNLPKFNKICSEKSDDVFSESFRFVLPGYNVRPLELSGALGVEQVKKLPSLVRERRKNGSLLQDEMRNHLDLLIQHEVGQSSWFGFSLVIRPESDRTRSSLISALTEHGFECRPIVAGNFAKNEVIKYFNYEIYGQLKNAEHIDQFGLFVGNHHYPIKEAIDILKSI